MYLLPDYMLRSSFTTSLFFLNTAKDLFIIMFSLVPGRNEMAYSKVLTTERQLKEPITVVGQG